MNVMNEEHYSKEQLAELNAKYNAAKEKRGYESAVDAQKARAKTNDDHDGDDDDDDGMNDEIDALTDQYSHEQELALRASLEVSLNRIDDADDDSDDDDEYDDDDDDDADLDDNYGYDPDAYDEEHDKSYDEASADYSYDHDDDDDDDDYRRDTIQLISMEKLVRLKIVHAHEMLDLANEWKTMWLASQSDVSLALEKYQYALRASSYAEEDWLESSVKTNELVFQILLCYAHVISARASFKKLGLLSPNSASLFAEVQESESALAKALKSYDYTCGRYLVSGRVFRNTALVTAQAYENLSLAHHAESESNATYAYWCLKAHDAIMWIPRAKDEESSEQ